MTACLRLLPLLLAFLLICSHNAAAQSALRLGSFDAAIAEPPVPRPATAPLAVPLFRDFTFTDYSSHPFAFVPPPGGKKRWAKIMLVADFFVTAGRQYDRTGEMSIGHTNVYFGTTAEPSDGVRPAWHVERDVTDDTALFEVMESTRTGRSPACSCPAVGSRSASQTSPYAGLAKFVTSQAASSG